MKGLKGCLRRAGMKQRELAEALGVTPAAVSYWVVGAYLPAAAMLPRIAAALGCTVDDLFREDPGSQEDYTQEEGLRP